MIELKVGAGLRFGGAGAGNQLQRAEAALTELVGRQRASSPRTRRSRWPVAMVTRYWIGSRREKSPADDNLRKVAGYGLPGRTANACHQTGDEGSNPLPSAYGPMVKRTSCLASNEMFRVRVLVGLLKRQCNKRKGNPIGDGTRLEAG